MGDAFAARYPVLFHVTERSALPGIRQHGLRSAAWLVSHHGAPLSLIDENRSAWVNLGAGQPPPAALRRQGMRDLPLQSRLRPGITPAAWRRFINDRVFFFVAEKQALRLRDAERTRCQVLLRFRTTHILGAAEGMTTCPFNNGYIDRSPAHRRRLRDFDDYRPVAAWTSKDPVQEVAIPTGLPPDVAFTECEYPDAGSRRSAAPGHVPFGSLAR
jgi:hypothetical protein